MSFVVRVQSNIDQLTRNIALKQKAINNATRRAINKTAEQVKTEASRQIRKERALPARTINAALTLSRATYGKLTARVTASGRPIALKHYGARGPRGRPKVVRDARGRFVGGPPVTVEIIRGRRKLVQGGFIGPNQHVFKRRGKARLPIDVLFGPSISSAMAKRIVNDALVRKTRDVFPKLLNHELARELVR